MQSPAGGQCPARTQNGRASEAWRCGRWLSGLARERVRRASAATRSRRACTRRAPRRRSCAPPRATGSRKRA
eukprot:3084989-Prymnesium_polylepis.1